jgi:putative tricarboxylic transport membrane protein
LLASLALHGVVYGPMIDFEQPGILNFFYGTLILTNIAMFAFAFLIVKPIIKLFSLPREILLPSIALLLTAGCFVEAMSMADLYIMFFFGLLGVVMRKAGFDTAPLCVGLVLGDMLDVNFRRAMVVFKDDTIWQILSRPIGVILIIIFLLTIWYGLAPRKKSGT